MKRENIYLALLAVAVLLLLRDCSGNGTEITLKTKEVKGGFEMVKPKQTEIVGPSVDLLRTTINKGTDQHNRSKTAKSGPSVDLLRTTMNKGTDQHNRSKTAKSGPSVDQAINTKLLAENEALIKAFATYTDSVKQAKYLEAISLKDFSQTFNDTSLTVNVFGKVRGEVIGIGMDYTIKPQTVKAQLKQYLLLGGVNLRYNGQFNKSGIDAQLDYISPNKTRYSIGKDLTCKDCFTVGVGKKIFEINRVK